MLLFLAPNDTAHAKGVDVLPVAEETTNKIFFCCNEQSEMFPNMIYSLTTTRPKRTATPRPEPTATPTYIEKDTADNDTRSVDKGSFITRNIIILSVVGIIMIGGIVVLVLKRKGKE